MNHHLITVSAGLLLALAQAPLQAKTYCGELKNAFGPFDYRIADRYHLDLVENAHFTEDVQSLTKGSTGYVGGDLDYTLRAFPNHAPALQVLMRLSQRARTPMPPGVKWPIECYFERAVRFQPNDGGAWALYAQYLFSSGDSARAMPMLEKAHELQPENPAIAYNIGLAYAKQKKYADALPYAQKAYAAGFPLPKLKQMLEAAGKWVEPPPAAPKPDSDAVPADAPTVPAAPAAEVAPDKPLP